ncbi:hypothetical protein CNR22_00630 [Sphingobacteriaceae bacterium]|nr:hypothetical protein CNR22_00630 [Sphingobacteriaceae bacterium]
MKQKLINLIMVAGLVASAIACDQPDCKNTNPVFDQFAPETNEYKVELFKELKNIDQSELRFVFEGYEHHNEQDYMLVGIQGKDLCAKALMTVKDWSSLGRIQINKGKGYSGAVLKNLKFEIQDDSTCRELIFKSLDKIID